jgi:cell division protease FtsH
MVTQWGLSEKLGPLTYGSDNDQPFLGHTMGMSAGKEFSETTAAVIDQEVRAVIERNYSRAQQLLQDNIDILHSMADALMKYETLDAKQVDDLMARRPVGEPEGWSQAMGKDAAKQDPSGFANTPSEMPPVIVAPGSDKSDK